MTRRRGTEAFANDMRTKVRANGLHTYPDLVVTCGEAEFEDEQLDTLRTYVLISQRRPHVRVLDREGERRVLSEASGLDATLARPTISGEIALRELYARVEWPENPPLRVVREEALV